MSKIGKLIGKYPKVRVIYDRRKTATSERVASVEVEILFEGRRKWISTGVRVLPKNWKAGFGVVGLPDAMESNLKISNIEGSISKFIQRLIIDARPFAWSELEKALTYGNNGNLFIPFIEGRLNERNDIRAATKNNHKNVVRLLKEFGGFTTFNDLTVTNITKFDEWLHARVANCQSSIHTYHCILKSYVNMAVKLGVATENPYSSFNSKKGKSNLRKYLTLEEVKKLEECVLTSRVLERARDLFVFQCYTGLSYADMKNFEPNRVVIHNGRKTIHDMRQKTGENFYIVLLPAAIKVLEKYGNSLPEMALSHYNLYLKVLACQAGISKKLTSHMGRHTFATLCLNAGINIEVLARMMGHTDIKTTQIYAKIVNTTVENAYSALEAKIGT